MRLTHIFALIALGMGAYLAYLGWVAGERGLSLLIWPAVLVGAVYFAALAVVAQHAPKYLWAAWHRLMGYWGR